MPSSSRSAPIDVVYSPEELAKPRESPFGATNGDLKRGLEFDYDDYQEIDAYCRASKIAWFASCWDETVGRLHRSVQPAVLQDRVGVADRRQSAPSHASDRQADHPLHRHEHARADRSRRRGARQASDLILLHACSTYPAYYEELNLRAIPMHAASATAFRSATPGTRRASPSTVAAVVLGACCVERHITLDRSMWGSDHAASLEPNGISRVVRDIRLVEQSDGRRRQARLRARAADHQEAAARRCSRHRNEAPQGHRPRRRRRADRRRRLVGPERRGMEAVLFRRHHGGVAGDEGGPDRRA